MHAALRHSQRLHTTRLTLKTHLRVKFSIKNLIHFWQHFDLEFLSRTILRNFDNERLNLMTLRSIEREFYTNDIKRVSKKDFLKQTKKIDKNNNKIEKRNEKKVWSKTKKKKSFFKSKIFLRFIFVFFTTHFRIYHLRFTAFFIHEKWSFSMIFKKNHTKNSIWILSRSKWSSSRLIIRKTSISRMKNAWFLAWKKTITIVNDNRDLHDVFSSRMKTRNDVFILNDWIRRFTVKKISKTQTSNSLEREIQ